MLAPPRNLWQIPTIGKFLRLTPVRELYIVLQVPFIHDHVTKLCRQQAEVTQNREYTLLTNGYLDCRHADCSGRAV
jgi:hypothetical protein